MGRLLRGYARGSSAASCRPVPAPPRLSRRRSSRVRAGLIARSGGAGASAAGGVRRGIAGETRPLPRTRLCASALAVFRHWLRLCAEHFRNAL
ncbi:predicted protein [Streptomyces sp. SPB78]|nr:predicted protein [Streptomyces sp. SPB78]